MAMAAHLFLYQCAANVENMVTCPSLEQNFIDARNLDISAKSTGRNVENMV